MTTPHNLYEASLEQLALQVRNEANKHSRLTNTTLDSYMKALVTKLVGEDRLKDGRAIKWRARLRIYDMGKNRDEPVWDSDKSSPPDQPGKTTILGMANVEAWIAELASNYHNAACAGLDKQSLARKTKNLRAMMSNRGDGTGTLRADYQVLVKDTIKYMLARCDVQRVDTTSETVVHRRPFRLSKPGTGGMWLPGSHHLND